MKTGWIVYNICDNSGSGFDQPHYIYCGNSINLADEDIEYYIINEYENWAIYARSYSLKFERDVLPPDTVILNEINRFQKSMDDIVETLSILYKQINKD